MVKKVQTACDRCTQGVMDQDNPHLHGLCKCPCHSGIDPRVHEEIQRRRPVNDDDTWSPW